MRSPDEIDDPVTEILRAGARRLIAQAVEAEFERAKLAGIACRSEGGDAPSAVQ
jgi:hypothetical protein